ncbi:hypothetical protein FNF29_07461 [Cafeteria roenbergensis]|uniref:Ubiquitin-like domain-containing protein n=1 Tax=Cafeteria roenbergensis TaxID=33653 RepID=A0A5A8C2H0_CAFRO|nr:hypothetical protein FNF29_07461 [Cafeteria roenbergensis]|eukprot:KAA0147292.1 hypothetical protein FNF29_07461 [Cafeteria roenbergensis]
MLIRVIRVSTGAESRLTVDRARDTVGDIKRRLFAAELAAGKSVRLVCNGTLLQDDRSVRDLDGDPAVVHAVVTRPDGGPADGPGGAAEGRAAEGRAPGGNRAFGAARHARGGMGGGMGGGYGLAGGLRGACRWLCSACSLCDGLPRRAADGLQGLHGAPLHELVRDGARSCSAEHVTGLLLLLLWLLRWWAPHLVDSLATGILLLLSALWLAVASHCGSRWPRSLFDPRRLAAAD